VSEISKHKGDLELLKKQDPEFFNFLQNNDDELLNFGEDDDGEDEDDEEEEEAENEEGEEGEDGEDGEEDDDEDDDGQDAKVAKKKKLAPLTKDAIDAWAKSIENEVRSQLLVVSSISVFNVFVFSPDEIGIAPCPASPAGRFSLQL